MSLQDDVAARLEEMANLLEADDVEYKPNAYRRAAESIRDYQGSFDDLVAEGADAISELDHVGDAISSKVVEYAETGEIGELEELRERYPVDLDALLRVEGVGPKTVGTLYDELDVRSLEDLESAARAERIRELHGFGPKTEENILGNIEFAKSAGERTLLGDARPLADDLVDYLSGASPVAHVEVAGSLRRWRATIGDIDVLVGTDDGAAAIDAFLGWDGTDDVIEAGTEKASVRSDGMRVDLRVVVPDEFGSALQYFTGSKAHNVALRNYAIDRGLKLNEYGAFDVSEVADPDAGQRVGDRVAGTDEASMYDALGLPRIPPEMREDRGEIAAAADDELPELVTEDDVQGDIHTHTDWSDGAESIGSMLDGAAAFGHDYIAVTDHATGPGVVGGVGVPDEELLAQADRIRDVADDYDVEVFTGVEANITADGDLSVDDDVLAELDVVVASPHAALDGDGTDRLVRAMEHPAVDILGHPTGRLLNQRSGLDVDAEALAEAAARAGVALEINSDPHRLDLSGGPVKAAVDAGATIAIDTDAHRTPSFGYVRFGVHTARRGWAEAADVLNTRDADGVREFLH
ncbi:DNA polymerase/3'-5' exonuclease PolX [Haloarchaeobius sp. FL176]|uniref:DNA polymerase/3'-5' exonuclease PolX n=1 Tax=Haloarchaeobius sp. FL176 TaxID=2967129 RepID=UPI0021494799|nr:DNA polymerase/3'-5' exonuclease PolX [Haloarchaeobius sp. FL176]